MEREVDVSKLQPFTHSAAGHDGLMCDTSMEIFVKPCTPAEIAFYEETNQGHKDLAEFMPTYLGTVKLGDHSDLAAAAAAAAATTIATADAETIQPFVPAQPEVISRVKKINSDVAIVLENLEYGFTKANVIDVKMGARLYADGTAADKMERLDKVAASTTSGSLNLRITGMRVWNGNSYDIYDKLYGRKFDPANVIDGFATFFSGLTTSLSTDDSRLVLEAIALEIANLRLILERNESRMYGASVLIIYEGDTSSLDIALGKGDETTPKHNPQIEKCGVLQGQHQQIHDEDEHAGDDGEDDSDDEDETDTTPFAFKVRLIDFAHSTWTTGQGKDVNVIKGLQNLERLLKELMARLDRPGG